MLSFSLTGMVAKCQHFGGKEEISGIELIVEAS